MVTGRRCGALNEHGQPCRQHPLRDGDFCFWHSPDHAEEAAAARRLGGLRRRRESTVQGAYEFDGLDSVPSIRRLVEIAVLAALGLDNSIARSRALGYLAQVALKTLEVGELEERLQTLEAAVRGRTDYGHDLFHSEPDARVAFKEANA